MSTGDINEWTGGRRLAEPPTLSTRDKSPPPPTNVTLPHGAASPGDPQIRRTRAAEGRTALLRSWCFRDVFRLSRRLDEMLTLSLKEILQFFVTNAGIMEVACEATRVFWHSRSLYCTENHQANDFVKYNLVVIKFFRISVNSWKKDWYKTDLSWTLS